MNLKAQKKLAGRALGVSPSRVKINAKDADSKKAVSELISREAARELVADKIITKVPKKGIARTRANNIASQKKKGRRQGHGSRKGTANARFNEKDKWMIKIRALRAYLKQLKDKNRLEGKVYRDLYRKSGGNFFRNKRHLSLYIQQNNLLVEVSKDGKK
ncbi:MAG: 50S ribosomal protein L19e [Nanoarchaeota archaeon]